MMKEANENGVSPIIGVILMVAVTIILAAVVAAFVFGMVGEVKAGKVVAVTAIRDGGDIRLTNYGGANVGELSGPIDITCTNATATTLGTAIGSSVSVAPSPAGFKERVMAVGTFNDGSQVILLDRTI